LLVIDYKTGDVSQKSWDLPRPEDVQLPLYGGFGLERGRVLGGLVFAKIRAGDQCFIGRVGDAANTLGSALKNSASLKKNPFGAEQLMDWRDAIEQLARDYIAGRSDVDPRDPRDTCSRCGLQPLCRIHERLVIEEVDDEGEADE
jgi:ATP-dependent helicase/nuclease subunit B